MRSSISCDTNVKPDFIHLNEKHIYTVWIIPYPLYSALCAVHYVEISKCVNTWPILAAASASIYNVI